VTVNVRALHKCVTQVFIFKYFSKCPKPENEDERNEIIAVAIV